MARHGRFRDHEATLCNAEGEKADESKRAPLVVVDSDRLDVDPTLVRAG